MGSNTLTKNLELSLCWFLSGNNLSPGKDAYRRWLVCNLVTQEENPEERPDLKIKDLLSSVTSRRTTLLTSALVILKAHALAGRPTGNWGPLGLFENWDPIVRGRGLVGHRRGLLHHPQNRRGRGPRTPQQIRALEAWKALPGGGPDGPGVTIEEACEFASPTFSCSTGKTAPEPYPELRRALLRFSPDGKLPALRCSVTSSAR